MRLIDSVVSNATGLFSVEESTPGVVPANPVWSEKEPNSYANFGSALKTVQRMPINANRRNKKGTIVGFTSGAGYETDLTPTNLREDMQGFFFADLRRKNKLTATAVLADGYTVAAGGAAYIAGTLLFAEGSSIGTNNGPKKVVAGSAANKINVNGLAAVTGQNIIVRRVGFEFAAGDAVMDVSGPLPALTTTAADLTVLGLIPGEIVYLGGDTMASQFGSAVNAGWCRVKSIAAHALIFDKTDAVFVADNGAGKSIQLFFGEVLRDEDAALQKMRTYSLMRQLGRPDADLPNAIQAEIVKRCVSNKLTIKIPEEDKIVCDLSFMGGDVEYHDDVNSDFPGATYTGIIEADAINSTGDMKRATMIVYPQNGDNSAPAPLLAVFNSINLDFDNMIKENKAVTRLGAFSLSPGNFTVGGALVGYFVTTKALAAVRNNADVSLMLAGWKANKGIAIDIPMLTLSTKGLDVKLNEPVKIPIDSNASTGRKYDPAMAHTALIVFYDYLPSVAND